MQDKKRRNFLPTGRWGGTTPKILGTRDTLKPECTKIARFSAVAAAIFTAPPQNRAIFEAPRCAISFAKKIASERRFSLRLKGTNLIPTAEFPAIPESAAKIASERRCAILVHSDSNHLDAPSSGLAISVLRSVELREWLGRICTLRLH